ncbi:DUF3043 domain-containing protein [Nocardioides sp.]|uniref:DUF3043 domain-containing protein n=1 Tax=Nocardioides sp. TaxID=35761 RepID=UPI0035143095
MFRRSKSASSEDTAPVAATEGVSLGKGRPTPTRKEAEAAARARRRPPRDKREQMEMARQRRKDTNRKVREGMREGDERYLMPRDKGPVRRFTRDFVDSRFSFAEIVIPLMIISLFLPGIVLPLFVVLIVDLVVMRFRLRKQLEQRFAGQSFKGVTFYAITRSMQMKFMRLPKAQVRIGQQLPERYR